MNKSFSVSGEKKLNLHTGQTGYYLYLTGTKLSQFEVPKPLKNAACFSKRSGITGGFYSTCVALFRQLTFRKFFGTFERLVRSFSDQSELLH